MKHLLAVIVLLLTLSSCSLMESEMDKALALRNRLLGSGCSFDVTVTADYDQKLYTFEMKCNSDANGAVSFEVTSPNTISGISGKISAEGGKLIFDDQALLFETIADGQITPVSAPWVLIRTLRSGYIKACGKYDSGLRIQIDDSYKNNAMHLEILTDERNLPIQAEILWEGRRFLSMTVENFTFL